MDMMIKKGEMQIKAMRLIQKSKKRLKKCLYMIKTLALTLTLNF